ncbi:hypothetical protein ACH4E8_11195 [Streptomyces sp. NPDC017979]|uniref:SCO2400 family protein n=1 Tax=Streptomyces sp. NPDC017979 TaxID=3365024 RepID=UPI0037A451B7
MDYCHQCRRHLNGALACAGCGTPAQELRQQSADPQGEGRVIELDDVAIAGSGRSVGEDAGKADYMADDKVVGRVDGEGDDGRDGGEGRAARRAELRRGARKGTARPRGAGRRARKKRGRNVLVGTLGLALAAGALSLAELASEGGDDGSATSVKEREDQLVEPMPDATTGGATPDAPARVSQRPTDGAGSRGSVRPTGTRSGAPGGSSPTGPKERPPKPSGSAAKPPGASQGPPSAPGPTSTPGPGGPGSTPSAPSVPPTGQPTPPEPTPTETCKPVLWWCW